MSYRVISLHLSRGFLPLVMVFSMIVSGIDSADAREWNQIAEGPTIGIAAELAVAPSDRQVIYVGSIDGRVFRSEDGGHVWTEGRLGRVVGAIVVDPTDPNVLYAASDPAAKSVDGGRMWSDLGVEGRVVAVDPSHPNTLWAADKRAPTERSDDGGLTWAETESPKGDRQVGFIHPQTGTIVVGGYSSHDDGETWNENWPQADDIEPRRYAVDPVDPQNVYAAARGGVRVSRDGGMTWLDPLPGTDTSRDVGVAPGAPENVYYIAHNMIHWSSDAGATWEPIGTTLRAILG